MHILFYGNGGSGNHGCEAIYRGTISLLGEAEHDYTILSASTLEDEKYQLDNLASIRKAMTPIKRNIRFLKAYLKMKIAHNYVELDALPYLSMIDEMASNIDLALSVGGDNYCYGSEEFYGFLNNQYHRTGVKTILWGCSVEPKVVEKAAVAKDLNKYNLIVARESITYEAIIKVNKNTILSPDPAFFMKPKSCLVDNRLLTGKVIGINISPMIISNEVNTGITYENYKVLIEYILNHTDMEVALIPHVVWESNDDRTVLNRLYEDFDRNERLILVDDYTAPELKYIISQCDMFVGARTHATIAYSMFVPTLVVGYSVKARGIARDLFGTEVNYVIPVQELNDSMDLLKGVLWLDSNKLKIREHLKKIMPEYLSNAENAKNRIMSLI